MNSNTIHFSKDFSSWLYKYKYQLATAFFVIAIISMSFLVNYKQQKEHHILNPDFIYNTWKVEKVYKNGKLVINNKRYDHLFLQIHRDGTAQWFNGNKTIKLNFVLSPDASQIIFDDGIRMEDVESIFELRPHFLRMGKKALNNQYEYVFYSSEAKDTLDGPDNFF